MCGIRLVIISNLILSLLVLRACTAALSPAGEVYICPGQPQTFYCSVINQASSARLEWRIQFEDSRSVPSVIQEYTTSGSHEEQHPTRDERNGATFVFDLTSNGLYSLESAMTITVDDDNGTTVVNNATVYCGQESDQKAEIHVNRGPPKPPTNLSQEQIVLQFTNFNTTHVRIQWNPSATADHYIIVISPPIQSVSIFITSNTSILLALLSNQENNISVTVMASNCAGNSTPTRITFTIECCAMPVIGSSVVVEDSSICATEGSHIIYYCQPGLVPSEKKMAFCMSDGNWSPKPNDLMCSPINKSKNNFNDPNSESNVGVYVLIPTLTVSLLVFSIFTFFAGLLLGILCIRCVLKTSLNNKNKSSIATQATPTTPVYEEVLPEITAPQLSHDPKKLVQNKAYESIMINN